MRGTVDDDVVPEFKGAHALHPGLEFMSWVQRLLAAIKIWGKAEHTNYLFSFWKQRYAEPISWMASLALNLPLDCESKMYSVPFR